MADYIKFDESQLGNDYADKIKMLRTSLGLTQQALADKLGVSFATVNRWENEQTKPLLPYWSILCKIAAEHFGETGHKKEDDKPLPVLDFTAPPEVIKVLAEGERLSFGHQASPTFATEFSRIDPLPHQRIAVYEYMLKQSRLRFLLADDAGAGKTIMTGLYIREMLSRRLLRRILIVTPAGLVGNWRRELLTLFNLPFLVLSGNDARTANPFIGENSDRIIISMDTLASARVFSRLQEKEVAPYDLVVFDEAHKLASDRGLDFRVRKTDRYRLAESLAGAQANDSNWQLHWCAHHLLLLTATPHMGKDYPYYALWRLLEPEILTTLESFNEFPSDQRSRYFIRRTKEEMVYLDGQPLYPKRITDTLSYELSQGEISEQKLYDETTDYLRYVYNKAKLLNREAARLALSVFQRRLASSTYALLRSFERRVAKLDGIIDDIQGGKITIEQLNVLQQRLANEVDIFEAKTADDESPLEEREENEVAEDQLLKGVVALSLADLQAEKEQVGALIQLAGQVYETGQESKFERLREIFSEPRYSAEKFIIFTEHRDTLEFLVKRLNGMGFTGQIAQIHGGMRYTQREEEVERFRISHDEGGGRFLVCTDAAGEGINLQFCWIMINYDLPWNPARLEQRMGRIHRYGQKHDPVIILNLVAPSTREGKVLKVLLDKLDNIRKELDSDKVFNCIGRIFEGISIKRYMEMALADSMEEVTDQLAKRLTKHHVQSIVDRENNLYGPGGDVSKELERIRESLDREMYHRLLPGYLQQYLQQATSLVDIKIEGDLSNSFSLLPSRSGAMDPLLPALEIYPEKSRGRFTVIRGVNGNSIWLHPGEPVFEQFRLMVRERLGEMGSRGAVFIDPFAKKPYLFHMALLSVVRKSDPTFAALAQEETLEHKLVGIKQGEGSEIELCPVEHLLLLRGCRGLPPVGQRMAAVAGTQINLVKAYLAERVAREKAIESKNKLLEAIPERLAFIERGYVYQEAELATARAKYTAKARQGSSKAASALQDIKKQQRLLSGRRADIVALLKREPELIFPGDIYFIAHALVLPSTSEMDLERHEADVERAAMQMAIAFEEVNGAVVKDVHRPDLAQTEGLPGYPGFDLLSLRSGGEKRAIEVKGRAGTGEVEVSANEWARACNMRNHYWLYVVYDCATPKPRLVRVQDPFGNLLAKAKGSVLISASQITEVGEI